MSPSAWLNELESRVIEKRVLIVEGSDDIKCFEHFLQLHNSNFVCQVLDAGKKDHVIQAVLAHPDWRGIIDCDELSPTEVQNKIGRAAGLVQQLPRFCIESYFCDPQELWTVLPDNQKNLLGDDVNNLSRPIFALLGDWVQHGAMWRVLRRIYQQSRIPSDLEDHPVTDRTQIEQILRRWHSTLDPQTTLAAYDHELTVAGKLSTQEQLHIWVHGKKYFRTVVANQLNQLLQLRRDLSADDWINKFIDKNPMSLLPPPDLQQLLNWIIQQYP